MKTMSPKDVDNKYPQINQNIMKYPTQGKEIIYFPQNPNK